jgi:hypothetical protein
MKVVIFNHITLSTSHSQEAIIRLGYEISMKMVPMESRRKIKRHLSRLFFQWALISETYALKVFLSVRVWYKFAYLSVKRGTRFVALMMEAASTFETSVNFYQTIRRNIAKTVNFVHTAVRT